MLVKLVLETTNAQKQNRSVMLLTGVGRNDKEEDQQQLQREREEKRVEQRIVGRPGPQWPP